MRQMPDRIAVLAVYLGNNPIVRLNPPAGPLKLPQAAARPLLRAIREDLLKRPTGFGGKVEIGGLSPLHLTWVAAGQTAGVAIWSRPQDHAKRSAGCVSVLLTGLEDARERGEVLAAMASRRLPVPPDINAKLDRNASRPLLVNVFYDLSLSFDPVLATAAPMLAHTFFALLGANVELEQEGE
jgi:hypothetical protein